jgi:hypothetical protein
MFSDVRKSGPGALIKDEGERCRRVEESEGVVRDGFCGVGSGGG